jgi:hypothetical protein
MSLSSSSGHVSIYSEPSAGLDPSKGGLPLLALFYKMKQWCPGGLDHLLKDTNKQWQGKAMGKESSSRACTLNHDSELLPTQPPTEVRLASPFLYAAGRWQSQCEARVWLTQKAVSLPSHQATPLSSE